MINEKPTCGKRRFACPNSHCVTNDRENLLQFNYHTRAPDAWRNATNCAFSLSQLLTFHKKTFKKMSLKLILHDISFTPPRRTSRSLPPPHTQTYHPLLQRYGSKFNRKIKAPLSSLSGPTFQWYCEETKVFWGWDNTVSDVWVWFGLSPSLPQLFSPSGLMTLESFQ